MEEYDYSKKPLTEEVLEEIIGSRDIVRFLNPRSDLYRERKMKEKPPSREEAIRLMLKEPNLLRRPVVVKGKVVLAGFEEEEFRKLRG